MLMSTQILRKVSHLWLEYYAAKISLGIQNFHSISLSVQKLIPQSYATKIHELQSIQDICF